MPGFSFAVALLATAAVASAQFRGPGPRGAGAGAIAGSPNSRPSWLQRSPPTPCSASRGGEALIVTDFGAVGDGHTDDTAAFQAALQAAAANGSNVFAPGRQYLIASGLSIPDTVTLEGTYRTVPSHPVGQGEKGPTTGSVIRATNGRGSSAPSRAAAPAREDLPHSHLFRVQAVVSRSSPLATTPRSGASPSCARHLRPVRPLPG